jgi:HPt (histidine-containing phosphotransfer) domain-containing protein
MDSKETGQASNWDIALTHVDGDRELLVELAAMFVQDYPRLRDEARDSILKGDCSGVERAAHTLKGRLAFFGIHKAREEAILLEMMGRTKDLSRAEKALADVDAAMESVLMEFALLSREQNP